MNKQKVLNILSMYSRGMRIEIRDMGIVSHPLLNSIFDNDPLTGKMEVMDSEEKRQLAVEKRLKLLESHSDIFSIFMIVNKPYRIQFLDLIKTFLDDKEYNTLLSESWCDVEWPHIEGVQKLTKLFKLSKKELLMDEDELIEYNKLPEKITVYRGLQGKKSPIRGLSWTLDLETAKWFAHRFNFNGKIYQATITKKNVFMFTNSRNESEAVVNPYKLKDIKVIA
jgi:hypothetical protein